LQAVGEAYEEEEEGGEVTKRNSKRGELKISFSLDTLT